MDLDTTLHHDAAIRNAQEANRRNLENARAQLREQELIVKRLAARQEVLDDTALRLRCIDADFRR